MFVAEQKENLKFEKTVQLDADETTPCCVTLFDFLPLWGRMLCDQPKICSHRTGQNSQKKTCKILYRLGCLGFWVA